MPRTLRSVVILSVAKNLASYFGTEKERFFVARKNELARERRAALLTMTALARGQKSRSLGRRGDLGMTTLFSHARRALVCLGLLLAFATAAAAAGTVT